MISICIPTYKGTPYLKDALDSVLFQTYRDFEVIICNDSLDDEKEIKALVGSYKDSRILFYQNRLNLGYAKNTKQTYGKSCGEYIFLLAQDDIVRSAKLFAKIMNIFDTHSEIGVITRPYYWFMGDKSTPIRAIPKINKRVLDIRKNPRDINLIIETCGQLSGLCFKRDRVQLDFSPWVFTAHIKPFLSVLRESKCYYMSEYTVAIRAESSQTRYLSSIYNPSPTKTWVEMLEEVFDTANLSEVRKIAIDHMCQNYLGLLQIKNYGFYKDLLIDIFYLLKFRPKNILVPKFWVFVLTSLLVPKVVLRKAVDMYKLKINSKKLSGILS